MKILRAKKDLKNLTNDDFENLSFPNETSLYVNKSLCTHYRGLWNKCKSLKSKKMIHSFFTISGTIRIKVNENDTAKSITHKEDLRKLFPDVDIDNLE